VSTLSIQERKRKKVEQEDCPYPTIISRGLRLVKNFLKIIYIIIKGRALKAGGRVDFVHEHPVLLVVAYINSTEIKATMQEAVHSAAKHSSRGIDTLSGISESVSVVANLPIRLLIIKSPFLLLN
jgi:hypothetical protein